MKLLVLAGSLLAVRSAAADCAIPMWIGTADGTALPPAGSLYVRDGGFGYGVYSDQPGPAWSVPGAHRWTETRISEDVVRLDYATMAAGTLQVGVTWEPMTYTIDPAWKAPAAPPRVLQYWHHVSEWTCSSSDSWMIQVDQPVAAFRVRWVHDGRVTEYVEPPRSRRDRSALEIGKQDCVPAPTVAPEELARGGELTLTAIRFDGSEVAVTGLPKFLRTDMLRTGTEGLSEAFAVYASPPPAAAMQVTNADSGRAFLVVTAGALVLLFGGLLLAGRSRTPISSQAG